LPAVNIFYLHKLSLVFLIFVVIYTLTFFFSLYKIFCQIIAGYLPSREPLFQFFHDSVNSADYACTLVWGVSHYSTDAGTSGSLFGYDDNQGYIFPYSSSGSYNSDGAAAVLQQYQYMEGKVRKEFEILSVVS
jgi:hypothetical protein